MFIWFISAASVVDLPDPVGPVTSTRPLGSWEKFTIEGDRPSSSGVGMMEGITRITASTPFLATSTFRRKRETPVMAKEQSSSQSFSNLAFCSS